MTQSVSQYAKALRHLRNAANDAVSAWDLYVVRGESLDDLAARISDLRAAISKAARIVSGEDD